jgi:ligand-binding sensor domain-containing protein
VKYDGSKFHSIELPELVKNDFIGSIAEDKKGNIWFATDHGVLKYNAGHFKLFTEKQGLSSNGVFSVEADDEGNIWIGTNTGGVNLWP